jgi:hypothetical protein
MADHVNIIDQVSEVVVVSDVQPAEQVEIIQEPLVENITIEAASETVEIVTNQIVEVIQEIEQSLPGAPGRDGIDGRDGVDADRTYVHNQIAAADVWNIPHNMGKHPAVTIVDSADTTVIGDVVYLDLNNLTVSFTAPFGGKAYLN